MRNRTLIRKVLKTANCKGNWTATFLPFVEICSLIIEDIFMLERPDSSFIHAVDGRTRNGVYVHIPPNEELEGE
jgi:hypothetical protein